MSYRINHRQSLQPFCSFVCFSFFSLLSLHRSAVFLLSHTQLSSKIMGCLLFFSLPLTSNPFPISFSFLFSASAPSIFTQRLFHLHGTLEHSASAHPIRPHSAHRHIRLTRTHRCTHTRSYKLMFTRIIRDIIKHHSGLLVLCVALAPERRGYRQMLSYYMTLFPNVF